MAQPLYTVAQVREIDAQAITAGIGGFELMQRAGAAAWQLLQKLWPNTRCLLVLCGPGNNGGDGFVIAALAQRAGLDVALVLLGGPLPAQGAAFQASRMALNQGIKPVPWAEFELDSFLEHNTHEVLVVDAMLGSGARGPLRGEFAEAVDCINQSPYPVFAIDVPTGVNADTGHVERTAIIARATISFIGPKVGLYTGDAADYTGRIYFESLMIPAGVKQASPANNPVAVTLEFADLQGAVRRRRRSDHKGRAGRVVVVGGDLGFGGAALMAAETAARSGAGTVCVITRSAHVTAMLTRQPEVMAQGVDDWQSPDRESARKLLRSATALVLGPGLGRSEWSASCLREALMVARQRTLPMVLDADALNLLASHKNVWPELGPESLRRKWILTPHPGEAARLLSSTIAIVTADRFTAVRQLVELTGCWCVLKGPGTLIAGPGESVLEICGAGNPGMASGGMGDVLAGLMAALLAQGLTAHMAARVAVAVHGEAADQLARDNPERGMLATDLIPIIRQMLGNLVERPIK